MLALLFTGLFSLCKAVNPSVSYLGRKYIITASAGPGGEISPSGEVEVKKDGKKTFDIDADRGYDILDVLVDGKSVGPLSSYKFEKVKTNHTIEASFIAKSFTITASAGDGGSISPSGKVEVDRNKDQTFSISPDKGYVISDVLVDDKSMGPLSNYTFDAVSSDHSIDALFKSAIGILNVTIPDASMKIGDVITASITVNDDKGIPYSLNSGTIGSYPLEGFQRISATTYHADFTVNQGGNSYLASQDIPVGNLVLSNGTILSTPYNRMIKQDNDPLDAELPMIHSMQVAGGAKKIGELVILNIDADKQDYSIHPLSTINGISVTESNIAFTDAGDGKYLLNYTVQEGDSDVGPDAKELEASIVLVKPSGNVGLPYSTISNKSQITIDAHAPLVFLMKVPDFEVGVGGRVVVQLTTDGTGYTAGTGTMVNGIPISSPRVTLKELLNGLYELSYTVNIEDNEVIPGELQASVVMLDPAGNIGQTYVSLEPNRLEIYTDLPEAAFGGIPFICQGEEAEMNVLLSGRAPWSFDLTDGSSTTSFTNITSSSYNITVSPEQTTTYQISLVRDVNGVENTGNGNIQVEVNEIPEVEIINLSTGYNVEADPVQLEANIPGGTFSGPGVISASGYFYPGIADTVNSPHTIFYTYENANGCLSTTSKLVYVLGASGAVLIPDNTICFNDVPFTATVLNVPGTKGSFSLLNSNSQAVDGLTDHGDNTATIDPGLLESDNYTIEYQYLDKVTLYLRKSFSVESAIQPQILNLAEEPLCQNLSPFELQSNLDDVVFEGPGVKGNMNDGFIFNPRETEAGIVTITCTSVSENGCTASKQQNVNVLFTPEIKFELSTECLPGEGEIVSFYNQTIGKSSVENWSWDFGDISSGENNQSKEPDPSHHYLEPGQKTISLTATTIEGCTSGYEVETLIDSKTVADFTWMNECFSDETEVKFINRSTHGSASVDTIIWTFKSGNGDVLGEVGSLSASDTVSFTFFSADNYQVRLYARNRGGCFSELSKEIVLNPTVQLDSEGYTEGFNDTDGLWTVRSENLAESWIWGMPDFEGYTQTAGDHAWYTRFPAGVSDYNESSWIQSPCFDFSDMERPLIQLDMMRSFAPGIGGAVLQYRDVVDEGWKTIGESTPGIEWYNASHLLNKPGGSSTGWGLDEFTPDREWVTAVHDLDQLAGKANVALRIAIASNGNQGMDNQGFAVNNVLVAERSKLAVLEHFTNYSDATSRLADDIIDAYVTTYPRDVIDLQYHMSIGGMDPMNLSNPEAPSTRSFNYGVPEIPYTVLDGGAFSNYRYNFLELKKTPLEDHLRLLTLEIPAFDIDLSVDWMESGMEVNTLVTCMANRYDDNIQLYLVVFESEVTAYTGPNGDTHFRNVVLDMLPNSAGRLLGDYWRKGKTDSRTHTWTYKHYVEDINDLAVAAFVQDRTTGQILQAKVDYKDETVGILNRKSENRALNIYPNPAHNLVYVNLGASTDDSGRIELLDVNGKIVLAEHVPSGYQIIQLDLDQLNRGIYILRWIESEQVRGVSKVVITR